MENKENMCQIYDLEAIDLYFEMRVTFFPGLQLDNFFFNFYLIKRCEYHQQRTTHTVSVEKPLKCQFVCKDLPSSMKPANFIF